MKIKGVEVTASLTEGQLTEELLETVYLSVSDNFVFCSVDMSADFDTNSISFLIGVQMEDEFSSDELAADLVMDALNIALDGTNEREAKFTERKVVAFA